MKYLYGKKFFPVLLICLLLSSCISATGDVYSEDALERAIRDGAISHVQVRADDGRELDLIEVTVGDIIRTERAPIEFDTSQVQYLFFERDDVRFESKFVEVNQAVSKGDVLAIAKFDTTELEAEIEILNITIGNHRRATANERELHQRTINEMNEELGGITDPYRRQLRELQIQRQQIRHNHSMRQRTAELERYNDRLEELNEKMLGEKLLAPFDGIIVLARDLRPGHLVRNFDVMFGIIDPERLQFIIHGSVDLIRFGDVFPAEFIEYRFDFEVEVLSDPIATNTRQGRYDFIVQPTDREAFWNFISEIDEEISRLQFLRLRGFPIRHELRDVIIVPRSFVHDFDDERYVLLYENGEVNKRFVEVGFFDDDNIQILAGLHEGQMISRSR